MDFIEFDAQIYIVLFKNSKKAKFNETNLCKVNYCLRAETIHLKRSRLHSIWSKYKHRIPLNSPLAGAATMHKPKHQL